MARIRIQRKRAKTHPFPVECGVKRDGLSFANFIIKPPCFARGPTAFRELQNPDYPNRASAGHGKHIADPEPGMRLIRGLPIDPYRPLSHHAGTFATLSHKAGTPKPGV